MKKVQTCYTAVELGPHRDVTTPAPRADAEEAASDSGIERIRHHGVSITISGEVLKNARKTKEKRKSAALYGVGHRGMQIDVKRVVGVVKGLGKSPTIAYASNHHVTKPNK